MARILFGSHMFRYPLGGMQSWSLQYMLGLKELGHEVYFLEKYAYPDSCYDPIREVMSNDCTYGLQQCAKLFEEYGLKDHWCFVSYGDVYNGLSARAVQELFKTADIYIDMGAYGNWADEANDVPVKVLIEGEPGYVQIRMLEREANGNPLPPYDHYFTCGLNIGKEGNEAPTAGIKWKHLFHPVKTTLFSSALSPVDAPYTSIMNWRSQVPVTYNGKVYGQKDMEFMHFIGLPSRIKASYQIALAQGASRGLVPMDEIRMNGWDVINSRKATIDFNSFRDYLRSSKAEFRVCKNVYVSLQTGWFSDVSACYLATGRPVVSQDTGFSEHLPTGKGLFAVKDIEEAAESIRQIEKDYPLHARSALEIAREILEAKKIMKGFMEQIGAT